MNRPKKILIVRTDRLGDVILSTSVIRNLRLVYPESQIAFMCRPYTKSVLEGNPYLDEVIVYDKYGRHKSIFSSIKFTLHLRKKRFDWALILHPTNRAHLITFFAGIPFRIGWNRKLGFLLTYRLPHTKQMGERHESEYTLDILRELNIPIIDKSLYFPLKKDKKEFIDNLLEAGDVRKEDMLIVIHPSASCPSKRWPQEFFSSLIELLKKEFNLKITIVTSKEEIAYGERIVRAHPDVIDLRGKVDIPSLGWLLHRACLFISNDSGPVHIAASLGTPVISIFGRKDKGLSPQRWRPLGEKSFYLHKDVGCNFCLAHKCQKDFLCLKAITPEEVFEVAKSLLKK
jgi:heptosyltransferase-2